MQELAADIQPNNRLLKNTVLSSGQPELIYITSRKFIYDQFTPSNYNNNCLKLKDAVSIICKKYVF